MRPLRAPGGFKLYEDQWISTQAIAGSSHARFFSMGNGDVLRLALDLGLHLIKKVGLPEALRLQRKTENERNKKAIDREI